MAAITVYEIDKHNIFLGSRAGDVQSVFLALEIEQTDYTMKPPPDYDNRWVWEDNDWVLLANPPAPPSTDTVTR